MTSAGTPSGSRAAGSGNDSSPRDNVSPSTSREACTRAKLMAGLPMNPATNTFAGSS